MAFDSLFFFFFFYRQRPAFSIESLRATVTTDA
jgi:hypothetical protein